MKNGRKKMPKWRRYRQNLEHNRKRRLREYSNGKEVIGWVQYPYWNTIPESINGWLAMISWQKECGHYFTYRWQAKRWVEAQYEAWKKENA